MLSVLLVVIIIIGIFAGCDTSQSNQKTEPTNSNTDPTNGGNIALEAKYESDVFSINELIRMLEAHIESDRKMESESDTPEKYRESQRKYQEVIDMLKDNFGKILDVYSAEPEYYILTDEALYCINFLNDLNEEENILNIIPIDVANSTNIVHIDDLVLLSNHNNELVAYCLGRWCNEIHEIDASNVKFDENTQISYEDTTFNLFLVNTTSQGLEIFVTDPYATSCSAFETKVVSIDGINMSEISDFTMIDMYKELCAISLKDGSTYFVNFDYHNGEYSLLNDVFENESKVLFTSDRSLIVIKSNDINNIYLCEFNREKDSDTIEITEEVIPLLNGIASNQIVDAMHVGETSLLLDDGTWVSIDFTGLSIDCKPNELLTRYAKNSLSIVDIWNEYVLFVMDDQHIYMEVSN